MDTFKVYNYRPELGAIEVCNFGCKHRVTYHEVKRITRRPKEDYDRWIEFLHYTHGGTGTVRVAYDAQGRRYEQTPNWDAPGPWKRVDGKVFWNHPTIKYDVARDLAGNIIK